MMKIFINSMLLLCCVRKIIINTVSIALIGVNFSTQVFAQADVVEVGDSSTSSRFSQPFVTEPDGFNNPPSTSVPMPDGGNDVVINLYFQLEALQQEVQNLRGIVEEQSYQIKRMQTENRDRYLDIDNRLRSSPAISTNETGTPPSQIDRFDLDPQPIISSNRTNTVSNSNANRDVEYELEDSNNNNFNPPPSYNTRVNGSTNSSFSVDDSQRTPPTQGQNTNLQQNVLTRQNNVIPQNEQELYRAALNLLVEDGNYIESINFFQQYIDVYSEGRYIANAYYWQGEALILAENFNRAKDAFMVIVNEYPLDAKAPGALLKLVVTHIKLGDNNQALQAYQDLQSKYPTSLTEIGAAEDYLNKAGI